MGSFLIKCAATKSLLKNGSTVQVVIFKQKLTTSFGKVDGLEIFIPNDEKHFVCSYNAKVEDTGFFKPHDGENEKILMTMLNLLPNLLNVGNSSSLENLKEILSGQRDVRRDEGINTKLDNNSSYIERYPLIEVMEHIQQNPQWEKIQNFIDGIHYNINGKCTLIKENGDLYILRASIYKNDVLSKCLNVEMENDGIIYTSANDYVKQRKNDTNLSNVSENDIQEYLKYEYLFKLGLPTDIPEYGGANYDRYEDKAYSTYIELTK